MPEHTGQAADLALQGHRAVGAPNHEFGLLAVATFLRTARHLIPHGHAKISMEMAENTFCE